MQTYARHFAYASHRLNETELKYLQNSLGSKSARQACIYLSACQNTVVNRTDDRDGELPRLCSHFISNLWRSLRAIHATGQEMATETRYANVCGVMGSIKLPFISSRFFKWNTFHKNADGIAFYMCRRN